MLLSYKDQGFPLRQSPGTSPKIVRVWCLSSERDQVFSPQTETRALPSDGDQSLSPQMRTMASPLGDQGNLSQKKTMVSPLRQRPGCYYHIRTRAFPSDRVQEPPIRLREHGISPQKVTTSSRLRWRPESSLQMETRASPLR